MVAPTQKKMPPPPPAENAAGNKFTVRRVNPADVGFKVCVYGGPKAGKSTLASLAPKSVFIDLNKGVSSLGVTVVDVNITNFSTLREVMRQAPSFVPEGGTLVIDSATEVDAMIVEYLKATYDKKSVKELGFDKFPCSVEAFRLLLSDLDAVVRSKRNVVLLAHEVASNYKNPLGEDYRILGPDMSHATTGSCQGALVAWVDHLFRLSLIEPDVKIELNAMGKVANRKVVKASSTRIITTDGAQNILAGSRRIMVDNKSLRLPPQIVFESPDDGTIWEGLKNPAIFDTAE